MIQPTTWNELAKIADKLWTALVALGGVLVGSYIANRSQRHHWVLDSKRLEFKELFATLTRSYTAIVNGYGPGSHTGEDERRAEELRLEARNTIQDRVIIRPEVKKMQLLEKWDRHVFQFVKDHEYNAFARAFEKIMDELRTSAEELIK
jgi:hypothetical protein